MKRIGSVLVAGAGPVGLTAALVLARAGIPVTVFEAKDELPIDLRASTWHPPTLDMLAELDLTDEIVRAGLIARHMQIRDRRSGEIAEFDMELLRGETDHPYRVQYEQYKYTRLVNERLKAYPHVKVVFGAKMKSVSQSGERVTARLEAREGELRQEGDYLVGADGATSAVRESLGIEFEGHTFPERFYTASTAYDLAAHIDRLCYVNYVADVEEWCVLLRVPGMWRCLFPTRVDEPDAEVLSDAGTDARLQALCPKPGAYDTLHRTIYRVHQRAAKRYTVGRVFLAGDAAHLNNPIGGMGMNGGLHDALSIAAKLVAVHRGEVDAAVLDRYEPERRPVAIEYINASTANNKKLMEERDPEARRRAQEALCRTAEDPVTAKAFLMKSSMILALRAAAAAGEATTT